MIKYFLQTQIFALLATLFFVLSCNGQTKTGVPNNSADALKTLPVGKPKLMKTQGSSQYSNIYSGLKDKEGNLWFGTLGEGVYRYNGKLFTQFTTKDGLNSNAVYRILQDKNGSIWFGTGDGVYCYDGKSFSRFLDNPDVINKNNLQLRMIDCIFEDKYGIIWFASGMPPGEEGVCRYDGKDLVNFKPKNEGWFRRIIEDQDRNLLFATRIHGVMSCNLSAGDVSMASFSGFPQPKALLNNALTTILKDKAGNIWMASDYGESVGDTLGGVWCYKQSETSEKAFSKITAKEVFFMLEDIAGNIWLGTRNTGLYRYDGKTLANFSE